MNSIPLKQQHLTPYQKKKHPTPNQSWYCDRKLCRYPSICKKSKEKVSSSLYKVSSMSKKYSNCKMGKKNEIVHAWFQNPTLNVHTYTFLNYYYLPFKHNQLWRAGYYHSSLFISLIIEAWENTESWWWENLLCSSGLVKNTKTELVWQGKKKKKNHNIFTRKKKIFQKRKEHAFYV